MIYEERHVVLKRGALDGYRRLMLEQVWPALTALGARPLCLLSGLIGLAPTDTYSFTGYSDSAAWEEMQLPLGERLPAPESPAWESLAAALPRRAELIEEEHVRLLHPSSERPQQLPSNDDQRAVYGMRRFFIHPQDWPAFERHSAGGIWVRIEAQGARILGLFHDAAMTDPLEVTLLTGYHGPAHWEATRGWREKPDDVSDELWELGRRAGVARNAMTLRSFVCLMNAHWPSA